jgi:hypothetical protein
MEDGPAPLKLQVGDPAPVPVPSAGKTDQQVLPEPGAGTAAVPEADPAFLPSGMPNWRSEPRQRTAEPSPEPLQSPAVDLENWVASLEAVVRGHSSRRDDA